MKSLFIGNLINVNKNEDIKIILKLLSKKHYAANHLCYAYILGFLGETSFSTDAGEPTGTAGKPILNTLKKNSLTNVLCVIIRYFGGVKLGKKGLIEAYSSISQKTIDTNELIELKEYCQFNCEMQYDFYNIFCNQLKQFPDLITETDFQNVIKISIKIEKKFELILTDLFSKLHKSNINFDFKKITND
jgi:uncharacterized YigZ family protein